MVNHREKGLMYGLFNRALWFSLLATVGNILEVQKLTQFNKKKHRTKIKVREKN